MDFLRVCGLRRSIRIFDRKKPVERASIQRILEVVRVATSCPGNLQPWRAIVIDQDKLAAADRKTLLAADNYQAAHAQATARAATPRGKDDRACPQRNRSHGVRSRSSIPAGYA